MQSTGLSRIILRSRSIVRFSSNGGQFISQLPPRNVISPFADPSRVTMVPATLENAQIPSFFDSAPTSPTIPVKEPKPAEGVRPELVATVSPPMEDFKQKILTEKPEEKPLSAIDELNQLGAKLKILEQSSHDGSGKSEDGFDREAEAEKRRVRMEKNTRIGGLFLLGSAALGSIAFALYYGRAKRDKQGNIIPDSHSGSFLAPIYRIYDSIWAWRDFVVEPAREVLLPDPLPPPYLQPKYTIVLEIKNVLINPQWTYKQGYRFLKRPALEYFLDVIGYPNFEVVIYTSESAMNTMGVVDSIDPKQRIMFRLFRDCTKYANGHHMKDLSKLNRDLSKVIYIDYDPKSGSLNPENMLRIPEWKGNADDTSLVDLAELLKTIHLSDVDDVRPMIQYYSQFDDPAKEFRRRAIYLAEQEAQKEQVPASNDTYVKRFSGKLFGFRRHQSA